MSLNVESRARFNLKSANLLLVENGSMAMDILVQILVGFGAKDIRRAGTVDDAKQELGTATFDLMMVGSALGDQDGFELVEWVRREGPETNKYVPLLMLASHTPLSKVERARDCGAHFIIVKPLKPVVMLERIFWIAREQRRFVSCDTYVGPDRRFKFEGPPPGMAGRRHDDLSDKVGDAVMPNMSQDQIDALLNG
jgi:DNA-binding response OmpR family regulator